MCVSIVCTTLMLHYAFALLGVTPEGARAVKEVVQFKLDYTFWMNVVAMGLVGWLSWLNRSWHRRNEEEEMEMAGGGRTKKIIALTALSILGVGIIIHLFLTAK